MPSSHGHSGVRCGSLKDDEFWWDEFFGSEKGEVAKQVVINPVGMIQATDSVS